MSREGRDPGPRTWSPQRRSGGGREEVSLLQAVKGI